SEREEGNGDKFEASETSGHALGHRRESGPGVNAHEHRADGRDSDAEGNRNTDQQQDDKNDDEDENSGHSINGLVRAPLRLNGLIRLPTSGSNPFDDRHDGVKRDDNSG